MRPKSARIQPLKPEEYTEEQKELIAGWDSLNFPKVMARHPDLYKAYKIFAEQAVFRSTLNPREREVVILRTTQVAQDAYEFAHHLVIARGMEMSEADIAAIQKGGAGLIPAEEILVKATDDLIKDHCISDASWADLQNFYSEKQLYDLIFLVGNYTMIAMMTSSFGMELEDVPDENWRIEREATVAEKSKPAS